MGISLHITAKVRGAIRNGCRMFACATGIDDITTVWYEKNDFMANYHKD